MKVGNIVDVKPVSKKMKDRVNSHGARMVIRGVGPTQIDGTVYFYLLESLEETMSLGRGKRTTWAGWVAGNGSDCELTLSESQDVD